jgi:predicted DNA-binding WGR domain protein
MTILNQWAGHFQAGGSDKVWAAASTDDGQLLSVWGRRGSTLQSGTKTLANQEAASKAFNAKVKKKCAEGYQSVPFDDPRYGIPAFGAGGLEVGMSNPHLKAFEQDRVRPVYLTSHVTPLSWAQLQECFQHEAYGVTEKINGVRCLVAFDGHETMITYNRRGMPLTSASSATQALKRLACQFVIDGEQLQGEATGAYVVFDLLEWQGQDVRSFPYHKRIRMLEEGMQQAGLITGGGATSAEAMARSILPELALLTPAPSGLHLIDAILAARGEGVIVRTLDAPYEGGDTKYIRKFKFLADLDAIVISINPGTSTGSVRLGLVRPTDGALIHIGNVRSGLNDQAIMHLAEMLEQGEQPVLTVTYLPIRTVGITLVEPQTSIQKLRTDKMAAECTTDQFGAEKAALIAAAKALSPSVLPHRPIPGLPHQEA